ncbi:DUF3141 domain-containing protein [Roseicella frigidaeris]|uniref:3-hydroxyalkanoate synthetase n=1 Tax=Roseicella frigidaeris TaxID=2230885 RepID=A0A327MH66_9PROT|nr:DUF3141 domain-containing protein [Roseicella frigidaeris]RAI59528.1 3-hydroxyalkanoate synthetase [Roseicella frigidaeris]
MDQRGPWIAPGEAGAELWRQGFSYMVDAWQRGVLNLDVLRQRGNRYHAERNKRAPNVLAFEYEVVLDGQDLERPVNYLLLRILPPPGLAIDPRKPPFVIVDPRAGQGPGIGGFKADSEIGVALRAGHACYLVSFLRHPVPGQTLEDVLMAELRFVEHVGQAHPEASSKPVVIGNCQAGWQTMMAAAIRPELFGPIIVAGAPLSYWAGTHGKDPMRYSGGLLGGSWLTALTSDLGHGLFDGAWLVQNFEGLNPANTLWGKQYGLYAKVDTEAPRYLAFEHWWGSHVLLNAAEIQFIVDNLFIGNKLATAELVTREGTRIDLRNIRSPIVVFCSKGDNITPPPQALGWITDLYGGIEDIQANGQTIVYAVHESVGHLGIFVSGKVARKEHSEFATNIDFIEVLPPGLYEAEIEHAAPGAPGADPATGDYIARFAARDLGDIDAIVGGGEAEERRFATVAQVSRANLGLYRSLVQPMIQPWTSDASAEWLRRMHPLRLGYELFSDHNPLMAPVAALAAELRKHRHQAAADNPFLAWQGMVSAQIEAGLDRYRELRDRTAEAVFDATYGNPVLQALAGLRADDAPPRPHPGETPERRAAIARHLAALRGRLAAGGLREAVLRSLLYVGLSQRVADERSFKLMQRIRADIGDEMPLLGMKQVVREQFFLLRLDQEAALAALPHLLEGVPAAAVRSAGEQIRRIALAAGPLDGEAAERLRAMEAIFAAAAAPGEAATAPAAAITGDAPRMAALRPTDEAAAPVTTPRRGR